MRILFVSILLLLVNVNSFSQENEKELSLNTDAEKAKIQIVKLRNEGALVVRLFLTKKKIELYRKYGNEKLANQLKAKLMLENSLIATAFADSTFSFCPVYLIDTKDYGRVINGEKSGYFLNSNLEVDSSITMKEKYFFFVERGPVYDQVTADNSFTRSETTSAPVLSDAFVIKDLDMNQLAHPFPFFKKIFFSNNLKANIGFYLPTKNDNKGGVWYFTPPISISEKLALKNKKDEYLTSIKLIEKKTKLTEIALNRLSKNITFYYKSEYGLKKTELTLPFNIYRLNVLLYNFYYPTIARIQRGKENALKKKD
tara:strand:+ start:912 stop:1850 length:939 start_codon:yes stop_codon:yes gene_type:complete